MIAVVLGGVGLFLLGMLLMTDGLRAVAGDSLRGALLRFTGGRASSVASGAVLTAVVQSSSATTLTTIGFVSAGLLTFPQAVGVVLGSNLGTTATGWLVALVGLKLKVSAVALPLVGVGALLRLFTRDRLAGIGLAIAGFGLVFVGIDTLQEGMRQMAEHFDPSSFPGSSFGGRLLLVGIGVLMTVVMQSSSAAVATTLAALDSGTLSMEQAAALVVGQNVGTTVTAAIAAIGASVSAKRTAWAHILFNVITGVLALVVLHPFTLGVAWATQRMGFAEPAIALAAFHTAFNVLGLLAIWPFFDRFTGVVMRMVPERGPHLTRHLDRSLRGMPPVAVETARRTLGEIAAEAFGVLQSLLRERRASAATRERLDAVATALRETADFLAAVGAHGSAGRDRRHLTAALHALDHLRRLREAGREEEPLASLAADSALDAAAHEVADALVPVRAALVGPLAEAPLDDLRALSERLGDRRRNARSDVLARTAAGELGAEDAARRMDAIRWLDRITYHAWRATRHLALPSEPDADDVAEAAPDAPARPTLR